MSAPNKRILQVRPDFQKNRGARVILKKSKPDADVIMDEIRYANLRCTSMSNIVLYWT